MVMTASLVAATAAGLATTLAPACASGAVFAAVRFHTVTWCPASMSRAAMAPPMAPSPATPICIRYAPDASVPARTLCDRWAARKPLARGGRMPYRLATQSDNEEWNGFGKQRCRRDRRPRHHGRFVRAESRGRRLARDRLRYLARAAPRDGARGRGDRQRR